MYELYLNSCDSTELIGSFKRKVDIVETICRLEPSANRRSVSTMVNSNGSSRKRILKKYTITKKHDGDLIWQARLYRSLVRSKFAWEMIYREVSELNYDTIIYLSKMMSPSNATDDIKNFYYDLREKSVSMFGVGGLHFHRLFKRCAKLCLTTNGTETKHGATSPMLFRESPINAALNIIELYDSFSVKISGDVIKNIEYSNGMSIVTILDMCGSGSDSYSIIVPCNVNKASGFFLSVRDSGADGEVFWSTTDCNYKTLYSVETSTVVRDGPITTLGFRVTFLESQVSKIKAENDSLRLEVAELLRKNKELDGKVNDYAERTARLEKKAEEFEFTKRFLAFLKCDNYQYIYEKFQEFKKQEDMTKGETDGEN